MAANDMSYAMSITLDLPYAKAVTRVKAALQAQGFGTLTEIDVRATLKEKVGAEIEPYLIIGACNPQLARRALDIDRQIGLLLPCNVVVREAGEHVVVQALDAEVIARLAERPEVQPIADEARRRIQRTLGVLSEG